MLLIRFSIIFLILNDFVYIPLKSVGYIFNVSIFLKISYIFLINFIVEIENISNKFLGFKSRFSGVISFSLPFSSSSLLLKKAFKKGK